MNLLLSSRNSRQDEELEGGKQFSLFSTKHLTHFLRPLTLFRFQ
jgi:hypothetical protein